MNVDVGDILDDLMGTNDVVPVEKESQVRDDVIKGDLEFIKDEFDCTGNCTDAINDCCVYFAGYSANELPCFYQKAQCCESSILLPGTRAISPHLLPFGQ